MPDKIPGKIIRLDERGIVVAGKYDNYDRAALRRYRDVTIILHDGRSISPIQRRKAFALIAEIADSTGYTSNSAKEALKRHFVRTVLEETADSMFSLGNCDMTMAREFITFLIDFVVENGIPTKVPLVDYCDDIERYVYACLIHKKCAVCGGHAQCHHYDAIGMGRNRDEICHIGMRVLPLCGKCHSIAHQQGQSWLLDDHKLIPIPLTAKIGKVYGMTKRQLGETT